MNELPKTIKYRKNKYGTEHGTRSFQIRLPPDTINKITTNGIDTGMILYNIIENKESYGSSTTNSTLLDKMIKLFIMNAEVIKVPKGFLDGHDKEIQEIAQRVIPSE